MDSSPPPASQASSAFTLEPVSAAVLADAEYRRRGVNSESSARKNGYRDGDGDGGRKRVFASGCEEVDGYVLLDGGFERGSVVGLSAEEEDAFGLVFGLQLIARSLCDTPASSVLIVTPRPAGAVLVPLQDAIRAELGAGEKAALRVRECLDRVMLSCVFDLDGLWEVLADLDRTGSGSGLGGEDAMAGDGIDVNESAVEGEGMRYVGSRRGRSPVLEIQDSEDEDGGGFSPTSDISEAKPASPHPEQKQRPSIPKSENQPPPQDSKAPDVILITHFSSLLTSLFAHREKSAAHTALQLLGSHLRYLSRNLSSQPLIMLLNSTASSSTTSGGSNTAQASGSGESPSKASPMARSNSASRAPLDSTLRSVFNPQPLAVAPMGSTYHNQIAAGSGALARKNKPSFGLVFSQLLDVHLLCTRVPRGRQDADVAYGGEQGSVVMRREKARFVTVVEVLLDELGVWEHGQGGERKRRFREQRWAAVDIVDGRVQDAFEKASDDGAPKELKEIRLAAGFGGRRL